MAVSYTTRSADVSKLRLGRSPTVADPKGFPRAVPLELHPWRTAWPLGHGRVEFEFGKGTFLLVSFWFGLDIF